MGIDPRACRTPAVSHKSVALETAPAVEPSPLGQRLRGQSKFRCNGSDLIFGSGRGAGGSSKCVREEPVEGCAVLGRCRSRIDCPTPQLIERGQFRIELACLPRSGGLAVSGRAQDQSVVAGGERQIRGVIR